MSRVKLAVVGNGMVGHRFIEDLLDKADNDRTFGLVAPGYKMAQVAADRLLGRENGFQGADMSAKLKLLGVDVGGIGDAHGRTEGARSYVYLDESKEVYKRIVVSADNKTLLGAVLVGDTSDYGNLLQLALNGIALPENPDGLILPAHAGSKPAIGVDSLPESAQICSCFDVSKGDIIQAVNKGCHTVAALKAHRERLEPVCLRQRRHETAPRRPAGRRPRSRNPGALPRPLHDVLYPHRR